MYPPPSIHSSELRPGRGWYFFAALLAIILIAVGVGGFGYGVFSAVSSIDVGQRFNAGETVTAQLKPDPRGAIFARVVTHGYAPQADCTVTGPSGQKVTLFEPSGTFSTTSAGATWREIFVIEATESGTHRIVCQSADTNAFSVGKDADVGKLFGGIFGGIASLFILPFAGIVLGVIISVVVGVKRGNHRRRLLAERFPPRY
jgi:hypothetical protein